MISKTTITGDFMIQKYLKRFRTILFIFCLIPISYLPAATVTNSADAGLGTLRQAIADATSGDTIDFDVSVTHITLTSGELSLNKSLTIDGGGNVTINSGGANRIFDLEGDSRTWNIYGLTMTNGLASGSGDETYGGCIRMIQYNHANTCVISNCTISSCNADTRGGAIYLNKGTSSGLITVLDSIISGNSASNTGGGIYSSSILEMNNVIVSNNVSENGGGIHMNVKLDNSLFDSVTFVTNDATSHGGAMWIEYSSVILTNCTFNYNCSTSSGGAIYTPGYGAAHGGPNATVTVNNCSFTGNHTQVDYHYLRDAGAILVGQDNGDRDTFLLTECTFDGNLAGDAGGAIYNSGNCTISNCEFYGNEALRDGGAIWNDLGFMTIEGTTSIYSNRTLDTAYGGTSGGGGLGTANTVPSSGWTVIRDSSIYGNTSAKYAGGLRISQKLTMENCIVSNNAAPNSVAGGFWFWPGSTAYTCMLVNVTFVDNVASTDGGGGWLRNGILVASNCTFRNNTATNYGGGFRLEPYNAPDLTLVGCTFSGNTAEKYRGGGLSTRSTATVDRCTFYNNTAGYWGGGICAEDATATVVVKNSTFSGNTAANRGGGIAVVDSDGFNIYNSTIFNNDGGTVGGGVLNWNSNNDLSLYSTIIASNTASSSGADLGYGGSGTYGNIEYCLILDNTGYTVTTTTGNIEGQNPLLAALADNGGKTRTHAVPVNSPCINAGVNPLALLYDQRNNPYIRDAYGGVDIGAFERWHLPTGTIMIVR